MTDPMFVAQQKMQLEGPPVGSRWQHFKGGVYVVVMNSIFENTLAHLVTYKSEVTGSVVTRTFEEFSDVHPVHGVKRFVQIS